MDSGLKANWKWDDSDSMCPACEVMFRKQK